MQVRTPTIFVYRAWFPPYVTSMSPSAIGLTGGGVLGCYAGGHGRPCRREAFLAALQAGTAGTVRAGASAGAGGHCSAGPVLRRTYVQAGATGAAEGNPTSRTKPRAWEPNDQRQPPAGSNRDDALTKTHDLTEDLKNTGTCACACVALA